MFLILKGQRYCKTGVYGDKTYWRCAAYSKYKCKARMITKHINGWEMAKVKCHVHAHSQKFRKRPNKPKLQLPKMKVSKTETQTRFEPMPESLTSIDGLLQPKIEPVEFITLD